MGLKERGAITGIGETAVAAVPGLAGGRVWPLNSRVHFRRGFDDSGFAKTFLLCDPEQPFLGTVRLEALHYRTVDISTFYPYGAPRPFQQRSRPC